MPKRPVSLYVERSVDLQLGTLLSWWREGTKRRHCVTLISRPGRGNTSLLEHFFTSLATRREIRRRFLTILVRCDRPASPQPPLKPLANEVYRLTAASRLSGLRRLRRRLRDASPLQLTRMAIILLLGVAVACVLVGFLEYLTSHDLIKQSFSALLTEFFMVFLPNTWQNFPLWLLVGSLTSLPLSLAFIAIRRGFLPEASAGEPSEAEIQRLSTREGLGEAIVDLCRGKQGLILLIDDARWLPESEVVFLQQLFTDPSLPSGPTSLRYLVLAVDWSEKADEEQESREHPQHPLFGIPEDLRQTIPVLPFDLIQLRNIFLTQLSEAERAACDEEEVLAEAQGNVKHLFAVREKMLAEEMGRELVRARDEGIEGEFGLAELLAYRAAGQEWSFAKKELLDSLDGEVLRSHLREFGIEPLDRATAQGLVRTFCTSSLVRMAGGTCHLDRARSAALEAWLQEHALTLLARAHAFWLSHHLRALSAVPDPRDVASWSIEQRQRLQKAAWHAEWILREGSACDLWEQAPALGPEERRQRRLEIARTLLAGGALWRSEGDLPKSVELIEAAVGSLDAAGAAGDLAEACLDHLWRAYWICCGAQLRQKIDELSRRCPSPGAAGAHARHEELLQGRASLSPPAASPTSSEPFLVNLELFTKAVWNLRQNHGFVFEELREIADEIPEPQPAPHSRAEFQLRFHGCLQALSRHDLARLQRSLLAWRDRLIDLEPVSRGRLGDEVFCLCERARYNHLLAEVAATLSGGQEDAEGLASTVPEIVGSALLPTDTPRDGAPGTLAWEEARHAYDQALQLAALLRWPPVVLEATFGLAMLLLRHTTESARSADGQWKRNWDGLFSKCIEIEQALGWVFYQPEIHRLRYRYFHEISNELSVEDAYNTLLAIRRAQFPVHVVLTWHHEVGTLLNNYGNSDDDRRRSAELHLAWARELAALPEAAGLRHFPVLQHEQANSLLYAAQAMRRLDERATAEALLDEADGLMAAAAQPSPEEEPKDARDLRISLRLQRAWLLQSQERKDEHGRLVRKIWREMRRGDEDVALVLWSLIWVEQQEGILRSPWPPIPDGDPEIDPDNAALSVPTGWLDSAAVPTRLEFRIHQFLSLLPFATYADSSILQFAVAYGGVKQFADGWLRIAEIAREDILAPSTRGLLIRVLEAAWFYFAKVEKVDSKELDSLRLLMVYSVDSSRYRVLYTAALMEYEDLLKRELRVQVFSEQPDWKALADRVDHYLGSLVDRELFARRMAESLDETTLKNLAHQQKEKQNAREKAHQAFARGNIDTCRNLLRPVLPGPDVRWVFIEDLNILDLWLRCYAAKPGHDQDFTQRADQLRQLALRFVRQLSSTIREPQIQRLVLEILEATALVGRTAAAQGAAARAAARAPQDARQIPAS